MLSSHVFSHDICPHNPPTKGDATLSVAEMVLPSLASPAAFVTGQGI